MIIVIPQNDKGRPRDITVMETATLPRDLTAYTVHLKAWAPGAPGTLIIDVACTKDVGSTGVCHYTPTAMATPGTYSAEIELTIGGTVVDSSVPFTLIVTESG
jgi:hypothetical protein